MHYAYALFIQALAYCCSNHCLIDFADRGLMIAGQVNVRQLKASLCTEPTYRLFSVQG